MIGQCRLCGQKAQLLQSHLVPKFVFDYIKETSATGKLRQAVNANVRRQDGIKEHLYCQNCEILFSKLERHFAMNFFHPYIRDEQSSFTYDEQLKKFIISLCWRILDKDLDLYSEEKNPLAEYAQKAHAEWREYLLGNADSIRQESHMFLTSEMSSAPDDVPDKMEWYLCRGTDGTIASGESEIFIYCLIPRFIFITSIHPIHMTGWEGTCVKESGQISTGQHCKHPGFYEFLCSREEFISKVPLSDKQHKVFLREIEKNPEKFINSETGKFILSEYKRRQAKRSKGH
jgi:hypothetical protein